MNVKGLGADALLQLLGGITEGTTTLSDEVVREMLTGLYESAVKNFTPFVRAFPALVEPVSKDLAPAIVGLLVLGGNIASNEDVLAAQQQLAVARAKKRFASYKAYEAAGFTEAQAFQLLAIDSANASNMFKEISKAASNNLSSGDKSDTKKKADE